jgi:hypothetical protein
MEKTIYDENHPFYYAPHPDSQKKEDNAKLVDDAVRQVIYYVITLIAVAVILAVVYGALHFVNGN